MTDRSAPLDPGSHVLPDATGFTIRPGLLWGPLIVLLLMAGLVPGVRQQLLASVVRAPEPYTALAFADPVVPVDCALGRTVVSVSNHLGRDRVYGYTVTAARADGRLLGAPARGRLMVASGQTATAQADAGVRLPAGARLDVVLDGGAERIRATCGRPAP